MENLTGRQDCDIYIEKELIRARINIISKPEDRSEVSATIMGKLGKFSFTRVWTYWVVIGKVPISVAEELYADPVGKIDIRVAGHCECLAPEKPWLKWYDKNGKALLSLIDKAEMEEFSKKSELGAKILENFLKNPDIRFVEDPTIEGEAFVESYHIDTEIGLRVFADALRKHGLV